MIAELTETQAAVILGVFFLLGIAGFAAACIFRAIQNEKERLAAKAKRQEAQREGELLAQKQQLELEALRRRREEEEQAGRAIEKAVQDLREAANERYCPALPTGTLEEIDANLRAHQLGFRRFGRLLTVRVVLVPTGWIGIEWMLDVNLANPLLVIGRKDSRVVFEECAYKGLYCDILARGRAYEFTLWAVEGKQIRDELRMVVKVPTPEQWERQINPVVEERETPAKRRKRITCRIKGMAAEDEVWEHGRREAHQMIDRSDLPDPEKRRRKALLDGRLRQERDKEEGGEV